LPRAPGQNQVYPVGQWFTEALERFPPHDHDASQCRRFEPLEVFGVVPRDFVARANHPIFRHCGDGLEVFHVGVQALACHSILARRAA